MTNPHRYVAAGVALIGAAVLAVAPVTVPRSGPPSQVLDIDLTAESIVIDFVRHAQDAPPADTLVAFSPYFPGAPISETGQQQAQDTADRLSGELGPHGVAGIYSGQDLDAQETAAPFLANQDMTAQILPGLNEVDGGIYANLPNDGPAGILYQLTVFSWALGLQLVQMPGSGDFNGVAFDQSFSGAVQTMYENAVNADVVSGNEPTVVAFSSEAAITAWVLMNANNPDLGFFLPRFLAGLTSSNTAPILANAGVVEITGNPEDGWTVVSFGGDPVPADPDLLTKLVVDVRDLITAPQIAPWNVEQAALSGDPTAVLTALQDGLQNIGTSIIQFPQAVFDDIVSALGNSAGSAAGDAVTALF